MAIPDELVRLVVDLEDRVGRLETQETLSGSEGTILAVTATSPVHASAGNTPNITIDNAAASGVKGAVSLATAPASPTAPIAVGDNDSRMINSRAPNGSAGGDLVGSTFPNPVVATVGGATAVNIADAVTKKHAQNTDTSTTSAAFQLASVSSGVKLKDSSGTTLLIRNAADNAAAGLTAAAIAGTTGAFSSDLTLAGNFILTATALQSGLVAGSTIAVGSGTTLISAGSAITLTANPVIAATTDGKKTTLVNYGLFDITIRDRTTAGNFYLPAATVTIKSKQSVDLEYSSQLSGWLMTGGTAGLLSAVTATFPITATPSGNTVALTHDVSGVTATTYNSIYSMAVNASGHIVGVTEAQGTSFPGLPATNQRYFRTDRGLDYTYNGTRWLSDTLFKVPVPFPAERGITLPLSATGAAKMRGSVPENSYSLWLEKFSFACFVNGTFDSTNYWTYVLNKVNSASAATAIISPSLWLGGRAATTYFLQVDTIGAVLDPATHFFFQVDFTKVALPGNLFMETSSLTYRLVG